MTGRKMGDRETDTRRWASRQMGRQTDILIKTGLLLIS